MFEYTCWIENVGVAPIYRRYDFAVKLTQGNRTHVYRSPVDIRKILPGDAWIEEQIDVPKEFQPGSIMLHTGLIDRKIDEPKVRFAVEGADHDGWMPLDTIEIT